MRKKPYTPSFGEFKKAEAMMTDKEREMSRQRAKELLESKPEVVAAKNFFIRELPFLDSEKLKSLFAKDLLDVYQSYFNYDPNRKNFGELVTKFGVEEMTPEEKEKNYRLYLINKLGPSIRKLNADKKTEELEQLFRPRNETDGGLVLGFHVSDKLIEAGPVTSGGDLGTQRSDGRVIFGPYYSTYQDDLYDKSGDNKYIYLVLDSLSENKFLDGTMKGWQGAGGSSGGSNLEILYKLDFTQDLKLAFGFKFRSEKRRDTIPRTSS